MCVSVCVCECVCARVRTGSVCLCALIVCVRLLVRALCSSYPSNAMVIQTFFSWAVWMGEDWGKRIYSVLFFIIPGLILF